MSKILASLFAAFLLITVGFLVFLPTNESSSIDADTSSVEVREPATNSTEVAVITTSAQSELDNTQGPNQLEEQNPEAGSESSRQVAEVDSEEFSPALSQLVGQEQLKEDIRTWEQHMEAQGLVTYFKGEPTYPLFGGNSSQSTPNEDYAEMTAEELVELANINDPDALLALANRAWSAGLWEEGDVYATHSASVSGSTDPILHGASQRLSQSPLGYGDRDTASWFLAAYLQGNMASAIFVQSFFKNLSHEDQYWTVDRANEIIELINNGG